MTSNVYTMTALITYCRWNKVSNLKEKKVLKILNYHFGGRRFPSAADLLKSYISRLSFQQGSYRKTFPLKVQILRSIASNGIEPIVFSTGRQG